MWDETIVPTLSDYIRIPNKSPMFDPDWEKHGYMQQAIDLLDGWCDVPNLANMRREIVNLPGRTPLLFCEIPSTGDSHATVLLYGHYDKQPEFDGWREGLEPWKPVIDDGRLYGRGGADDGYSLFGSLTAIAALEDQGIPHARCVVIIEGCEESGSYDLPHYIEMLKARIGTPDLVVCLDSECGNYDQLWLTTSLRGMISSELTVKVLTEGVHSGMASGIVPSSFRILRQLLDRIEDAQTGKLNERLTVEIPESVRVAAQETAVSLGKDLIHRFPWEGVTQPVATDSAELILNNTWRPTLSITGISGAPPVKDAGNTLRPFTSAKLSIRIPPGLNAHSAADTLKRLLENDPPYQSRVNLKLDAAQDGWFAPELEPWLRDALTKASNAFFQQPMRQMGIGGSIPFMKMLGDSFPGVQFVITGVLGPHSNAHGPNEFLDIETGKRVTSCIASILADHALRQ